MKTKIILLIILIAFSAITNTSCELGRAEEPTVESPPQPDPVEILEQRLGDEKQLRTEAEETLAGEITLKERWQLAATALAVLTMLAFLAGTSIGSRGRKYANAA